MEKKDIINNLSLEFRRGTLVLLTLALLREPKYGYALVQEMEALDIAIDQSTLYPLLRRLETQEVLASSWDTETTKPRKYYVLTPFGEEILSELEKQWIALTKNTNKVLGGKDNE